MSGYHIPQSRTHNAPAQFPLYYSPYYNHSLSLDENTSFELGIYAVTDPRLRAPATMPNFSSMTNSALVNALLTPSVEEQQEQQKEQNVFLAGSNISNPTGLSKKRSRHSIDNTDELSGPINGDHADKSLHDIEGRPSRKPRKQPKRTSAASVELDDEYIGEDRSDSFESTRQKRKPRRSTRSRKSPAPIPSFSLHDDNELQHVDHPAKVENARKLAAPKKVKKPRANRLIRKKPIGMAVPKTLSEANEADRMMWEWKNAGRNWEEIRTEWKRLTGIEPGGSSLSVRYIKLNENLARNGAAGDIELLRFRKEAEEELMSQLWPRVADKMLAFSPESEHNPKDLQKRYNMIVRSGYDVEKLVQDDKIKREEEHKSQQSCTKTTGEADPVDGSMANSVIYEDAVNDSAEVFRNENDLQNSRADHGQDEHPEQDSEHMSIAGDTSNIFENLDLLQHQVDGLIEPEQFNNPRFDMHNCRDLDTFMSDEILASHSPSIERVGTQKVDRKVPLTSSLVSYNSDSE